MKWLRVASKQDKVVDAAPLTVEAKGERAKIRELRQRLEKEDKASEIKALSDAIDALESRMDKDKASREKRKQEKLEKAKNKPAEPAPVAEAAKPVEAAGRRPAADTEDESNIELDMESLDEHTDGLNEVDDDADLHNPMRVAPGDIMSIELPSQGGQMRIEVDMTAGQPQVMSVTMNGEAIEGEDLESLLADEEFMSDVEHAAIAKMHGENPEPMPEEEGAPMHDHQHEMEAVPAALLGQMTAFAEVISSGEYEGDPALILQLQAQLEDLGARYPKSAGQIGELYHALDQGYRELMENARPVRASDEDSDSDADEADDKDDEKDEAPKKDKKPEAPKSEKKDAPAAPKKDAPAKKPAAPSAPKKNDESKDISDADDAIEMIMDLIDKEKGDMEGGKHVGDLEQALKLLQKFVGEEHMEGGDADMFKAKPPMPGGAPKPPMPGKVMPMKMEILPPAGGPAKGPAGMPPAGPAPMKPMSSWLDTGVAGFPVGARVWRAEQTGSMEYVGDESGRVVANEGGKVIVDWGDEIPTENLAGDLTLVQAADGEGEAFEAAPDLNLVADEQDFEARTADDEAAAILSSLSLKDMLSKAADDAVDPDAIVHLASGKTGKFIATASEGRVMISIGGKSMTVYAYEIAAANNTGEGLF